MVTIMIIPISHVRSFSLAVSLTRGSRRTRRQHRQQVSHREGRGGASDGDGLIQSVLRIDLLIVPLRKALEEPAALTLGGRMERLGHLAVLSGACCW